ncbi:MAG: hypothetical protein J4428_02645 [Candidatus Aenigmarchaeota archaeon]|nr:hypothetical protein [Candidatus Aenigmarchaeota archaeon]
MNPKDLMAFSLTLIVLIMSSYFTFIEFSHIVFALDKCKNHSAEINIESSNVDLEVGKGRLLKAILKNNGEVDDFQIIKDGPDWVVIKPEKTRLNINQTEEIFVYMSPDLGSEGKYKIKIMTKSSCVYLENEIIANVLRLV